MRVAVIAWDNMTPAAKDEASRLLRINPRYAEWVAEIKAQPDSTPEKIDQYAFIRASVWADDIKGYDDYTRKGDTADGPNAARNIGYTDKLVHDYWHFRDIPFSTDGSTWPEQDKVNAETQIRLFIDSLPKAAGLSDDMRSYDLAWLLHLVGDVHQPLHSTAYFSKELTKKWADKGKKDVGDRGGNEIYVVPANGVKEALHFYWDGMFGGYSTVRGALTDNGQNKLEKPSDDAVAARDPAVWLRESHEVAMESAYSGPVSKWVSDAVELDRTYETKARAACEKQLALAGYRLAAVLDEAFK